MDRMRSLGEYIAILLVLKMRKNVLNGVEIISMSGILLYMINVSKNGISVECSICRI